MRPDARASSETLGSLPLDMIDSAMGPCQRSQSFSTTQSRSTDACVTSVTSVAPGAETHAADARRRHATTTAHKGLRIIIDQIFLQDTSSNNSAP